MSASEHLEAPLRPRRRRPDRLRHHQPQQRCAPARRLACPARRGRRAPPRGATGRHHRRGRRRSRECPPPRPGEARCGADAPPAGGPGRAAALSATSAGRRRTPPDLRGARRGRGQGRAGPDPAGASMRPARGAHRPPARVPGRGRCVRSTTRRPGPRSTWRASLGMPVAAPRALRRTVATGRGAAPPHRRDRPRGTRRVVVGRGAGRATVAHSCAGCCSASGSISFGAPGPHVEFVACRSPAADGARSARWHHWRYGPSRTERRGRHVVYLKGQEEIVALLRLVGANRGVLELETHRVGRDVRARLNRLLNAEEANLGRTVRAADRQLSAIARLEAEGRMAGLSTALRETAAMRRRMPEADLDTLAAALGVSRSAVNHRLRRLVELAQRRGEVMRRPVVAGNWKMNPPTLADASPWPRRSEVAPPSCRMVDDVVVCPPTIWLDATSRGASQGRRSPSVPRRCTTSGAGAFTGETSPSMLVGERGSRRRTSSSATPSARSTTARRTSRSAERSPARSRTAYARSRRWGSEPRSGEPGQTEAVIERQVRAAIAGLDRHLRHRAGDRLRAGLGHRDRRRGHRPRTRRPSPSGSAPSSPSSTPRPPTRSRSSTAAA